MTISGTRIGDLSNNKYAAAMNELAEGLKHWSNFLLWPFLIYRILAHDAASLISLKALLVALGSAIVFAITARFIAELSMLLAAALIAPLIVKEEIQRAQNIINTIKAIIGFSLCLAAWFYAGFVVDYAYPYGAASSM